MSGVDGRTVIVTGAGRGLGRQHALVLGSQGARVVVNDLGVALDGAADEPSAADSVAETIVAEGGDAIASHDDVATPQGGEAVVRAAIDGFGRVDGVVNNAGILRDSSFHKMSAEEFDAVLKVHLYGTFNVTRAAMPHFREQGYGRIVVTTSVTGLYGNFGQVNYGAAKLGLVGMINTLAIEGRTRNVLANAISPIATTRMSAGVLDEEYDPAYVSVLVAHLVGEECTTSGEIIHAAGGRYSRVRYMESRGIEFDAVPTPEQLTERWNEIMDMGGARLAAPA